MIKIRSLKFSFMFKKNQPYPLPLTKSFDRHCEDGKLIIVNEKLFIVRKKS